MKTSQKISLTKEILIGIKEVNKLDYEGRDKIHNGWDGSLSFSGVKRMIYGLWNEGKNEDNCNMVPHFSTKAQYKYKDMIKKYSKMPKIKLYF